jgi:predicted AlkP superfamily pyrophosphatase or phosphodiesterase
LAERFFSLARREEAGAAVFNQASFNAVDGSTFSQHFIRPRYDSYCFSNIPATIAWLLSGQGQPALPLDVFGDLPTSYEKVIFFFVDGFGWRFFERYAEHYPILKTIATDGVVSKLTSQFPSTTAAHVTSIHTGLDVGQSGVYEWYYYEPLVDEIIMPLRFSFGYDRMTPDTLKRAGIPSTAFFPQQTFYQGLLAQGITSHVFQPQAYAHSTYSQIVFQGAAIHGYTSLSEALASLAELVKTPEFGPTYYFFYFDRIDSKGHLAGPDSPVFDEAVKEFSTALYDALYQPARGKTGKTLLLLSADHGHMQVDPHTTFYLNVHLPELTRLFKTNARGVPIVPAGSPRDMFLYIREEQMPEAIALLQQRLAGKAEIYATQDLLAQGFFGTHAPSPELLGRLGNVVILPLPGETVWWLEAGSYDMTFLGHHGGLTPHEMEIPLLALPL